MSEASALVVKSQEVVPSIQLEEADGSYAVRPNQEDRVDARPECPDDAGRATAHGAGCDRR